MVRRLRRNLPAGGRRRARSRSRLGRSAGRRSELTCGRRISRRGLILVFGREGGGHVGFHVGEDDHAYHAIGGNQSNSVCITRIAKSRLIAARWPRGVPVKGGPVQIKAVAGVPLSRNEA